MIPPGDANVYLLSAKIGAAPAASKPADHNAWQGPLEFPEVKISAPKPLISMLRQRTWQYAFAQCDRAASEGVRLD
jgi:hypothetical protein